MFWNNLVHELILLAIHPTTHDFVNGQGISIFNGTAQHEINSHTFDYTITALNIGREIGVSVSSINAEIVSYDPQYTCHPYPLLKDNFEVAYNDRQAVACHYIGNLRDGMIHTMERSKINDSYNVGVGYDSYVPEFIHQNFTFSKGINSSNYTSLESYNYTAMFLQEGYGKLYFDYPLGDIVLSSNILRYENVTTYTTLYSNDFAAKDTIIHHHSMRYPETEFTKNIIIKNLNQNGTIINGTITLEVEPYREINAEYIKDYIYDKIKFDTSNEIFAAIISEDTYPMEQTYTGDGMLDVTISKTPIFFDEHVTQKDYGDSDFLGKISDLSNLLKTPDTIRLSLPYDIGLVAPSPTTLKITINGIENILHERYYTYGGKQIIIVNMQKDNVLQVERTTGKIVVIPPVNFGPIDAIFVDDTLVKQDCKFGCVLLFQPEKDLDVKVENMWGGIASTHVPKPDRPHIPITEEPDYGLIAGIVFVIMLGYFVISKFRTKQS